MTDAEIRALIERILSNTLSEAGFSGAHVVSDFDSAGDRVLRVTARYEQRPSGKPDPLINAIHPIREALIALGEERPVLLKNEVESERRSDRAMIQEDVD